MLEGKLVNLRKAEKEDVDFLVGLDDIDFWAEYNNPPFGRMSKSEWMKWFDAPRSYLENLIEWSARARLAPLLHSKQSRLAIESDVLPKAIRTQNPIILY